VWTIDLHGTTARAAVVEVAKTVEKLHVIAGSGGVTVRIITGRGKHSRDGVAVLRAQVLQYLAETGQPHELEPGNEGVVLVHITSGEGAGGSGGLN